MEPATQTTNFSHSTAAKIITIIFLIVGVYFGLTSTPKAPTRETSNNGDIIYDTGIDTTGWQTYHNDEYGFEFKYPANFVAEGNWAHPYSDCADPVQNSCGFSVTLAPQTSSMPYFGLMINFQPDGGLYVDEPQTVYILDRGNNGSVAIASEVSLPGSAIGELEFESQKLKAIIKNDDDNYIWYGEYELAGSDYRPLFKQILSTFRFLDDDLSPDSNIDQLCLATSGKPCPPCPLGTEGICAPCPTACNCPVGKEWSNDSGCQFN